MLESSRQLAIQLFGVADTIDPLNALLSFIIVIAAIMILELIFHELHHMTQDTTYQNMILAIENELMIVGSMAFILKIILSESDFVKGLGLRSFIYIRFYD